MALQDDFQRNGDVPAFYVAAGALTLREAECLSDLQDLVAALPRSPAQPVFAPKILKFYDKWRDMKAETAVETAFAGFVASVGSVATRDGNGNPMLALGAYDRLLFLVQSAHETLEGTQSIGVSAQARKAVSDRIVAGEIYTGMGHSGVGAVSYKARYD